LPLDATTGGTSSNSYLDADEAADYFAERLHSSAWTAASAGDKDAALIQATRVIDARVCFAGMATTATQALRWPRSGLVSMNGYPLGDDVIPDQLKDAVCELALTLLDGDVTIESEIVTQGITKVKADTVEVGFDTAKATTREVPKHVIEMLVPAWLCPPRVPRVSARAGVT
jgi:hypothetical protein